MAKTIEITFHDLINPLNSDKLDDNLPEFLEEIRLNEDNIVKTIALIGHKLQSPLELEALTACHIVEYLMREGSHEIHKHVAMYKFLNDCIRVLSPKYLGKRTTQQVKYRVTELLFCWSEALPHYVKLRDAYMMLRRNGIIKADPKYNDRIMMKNISQAERPSYLDENRELLLKSLLSSKNPQDHAKANKLIQKLIAEDDEKIEKQSKRIEAIDKAIEYSKNLIKLVEILPANSQGSTLTTLERKKVDELYVNCTRLRPTIFRMASENDQSEMDLTKILKANDELTKSIQLFDLNIGKILHHPDNEKKRSDSKEDNTNLLDFDNSTSNNNSSQESLPKNNSNNTDLLTSSLLDLGLGELVDSSTSQTQQNNTNKSMTDILLSGGNIPTSNQQQACSQVSTENPPHIPAVKVFQPKIKYTIEQLSLDAQNATTIYDKNNLRCIATPCQNKTILFTMMSTNSKKLNNFQLQLSVTKNIKCYLSDPDKTSINSFSPIQPNLPINQIVYFQYNDLNINNQKEPTSGSTTILIRFRLIFNLGDDDSNKFQETGESSVKMYFGEVGDGEKDMKQGQDLVNELIF